MYSKNTQTFEKKTFDIISEYADDMKRLIPSKKQTEFVNRTIKHELNKEIKKNKALSYLKKMKQIRESLPKSKKQSEELLAELRRELEK